MPGARLVLSIEGSALYQAVSAVAYGGTRLCGLTERETA